MKRLFFLVSAISLGLIAGFFVSKLMLFLSIFEISVQNEKNNSVEIVRNSYNAGCLQSFDRVCGLLKKNEISKCVNYADSYCKDAAGDYANKFKIMLYGKK